MEHIRDMEKKDIRKRNKEAAVHFVESGVQSGLARISRGIKMVCDWPKVYLIASLCFSNSPEMWQAFFKSNIWIMRIWEKQMDTLPPKTRAWKFVFAMKLSLWKPKYFLPFMFDKG